MIIRRLRSQASARVNLIEHLQMAVLLCKRLSRSFRMRIAFNDVERKRVAYATP